MRRGFAISSTGVATIAMNLGDQQRQLRPQFFEKPLDKFAGPGARKGPPTAHSLPVYKTAHKLASSARWKNANVVTNVCSGKDFRLSETHGEGRVDETGMYRDWLYGEERRFANYVAFGLFLTAIALFSYTVRKMGSESWEIPAPALLRPDLIKNKPMLTDAPSVADRALEASRPRPVRPANPGGLAF
jgi:hypothetical protein